MGSFDNHPWTTRDILVAIFLLHNSGIYIVSRSKLTAANHGYVNTLRVQAHRISLYTTPHHATRSAEMVESSLISGPDSW